MIAEHILGNVRDGVTETVVNIPFESVSYTHLTLPTKLEV